MREFIAWLFWPVFVALTRYMGRCGFILYGGGKGDKPDPPDYTPMANASKEAAEIGAQLGREQLAETKRQYAENMAVAKPVIQAQIDLMNKTAAQGDEYYAYNKDTFRPVEQSLVKDALEFNTEDAKERFARSAAADLEGQQANEEAQQARAMTAMGVNPNSGRFVAATGVQRVLNAANRAGATTAARERADNLAYAKKMDVTGLGRGLPGASQGAYTVATNAGNSATGNQNQTAAQYLNGLAAGNGTIMQGKGQQISGLGSILNSQTSLYDAQTASAASGASGTMGLAGAGLGAAATIYV